MNRSGQSPFIGRRTNGRRRFAKLAIVGAVTLAPVAFGTTLASAAVNTTAPQALTSGTSGSPLWVTNSVQEDRSVGSDTTFFMMQKISDLYTSAGLFGCALTATTDSTCQYYDAGGTGTDTQDLPTTDFVDNYNRVEENVGTDLIGSGNGLNMLCGVSTTPVPTQELAPAYARSSKFPSVSNCTDLVGLGYAKDGVPGLDFPDIIPGASNYGATIACPAAFATAGKCTSGSQIALGPVAAGWLPGDSITGPYSGTPFNNISDVDVTGGGGVGSIAYRTWCIPKAAPVTGANGQSYSAINDWGELTNLTPPDGTGALRTDPATVTSGSASVTDTSIVAGDEGRKISGTGIPTAATIGDVVAGTGFTILVDGTSSPANANGTSVTIAAGLAVGFGEPLGIPVNVIGINSGSGTVATWATFANSGEPTGSLNCAAAQVAANNAVNTPGTLENNASQIVAIAIGAGDNTPATEAAFASESLYFISNGVYNTNPHAGAVTITDTNGVANKFAGFETTLAWSQSFTAPTTVAANTPITVSTVNDLQNVFPTARTLYNAYRTSTIRASAAGFLDWMCDSNNLIPKQVDPNTGVNYDQELSNIIVNQFGFNRLNDTTPAADNNNAADPNNSCNMITTVASNT